MAMLLGKKIGMTQVYTEEGKMVPVTVIQAGPCVVTQVKNKEIDGYDAIQLGFDDVKKSRIKKPCQGHSDKAKTGPKRFVRDYRLNGGEETEVELGSEINVSVFAETNVVDVVGTSKGKGYAGVMKRHGFGGFPASHGCERKHRAAGSISSNASDAGCAGNVKKGKKMAGRMGGDRITTRNHNLISIDEEKNVIVVKGAVAGASGGYVIVRTSKKDKIKK